MIFLSCDFVSQEFRRGSAGQFSLRVSHSVAVRCQLGLDSQSGSLTWLALNAGQSAGLDQSAHVQCPPARTSQGGWIPPLIPGFPQKHVPTDKAEVARLNVTQPLKSRSINSIALYWLQISHKEQPRFKEAGTVHIPQQEEYQRICGHGFKPTPEAQEEEK